MRKYINEDGTVFNSFLGLISQSNYTMAELNKNAVIEFLTFGSVQDPLTFIKKVQKATTDQLFIFTPDTGLVEQKQNDENPLIEHSRVNIEDAKMKYLQFFEKRKSQLQVLKISIDLTGGVDSRLIACTLRHFDIPFDAAYSQISGNKNEQRIAEKVAKELDVSLKIISDKNEITSKSEIEELYKLGDGMWDPISLHSLRKTQAWRRNEGYDLAITGVAGAVYKDFWWQQDFPFYKKKKSNLDRLLKLRMYPVILPVKWISNSWKSEYICFIPDYKSHLKSYRRKYNSQTYDQIGYHIRTKEQVSVLSHASAEHLPVYSPLIENELLEIGYNMEVKARTFNRFHRYLITDLAPNIAKIPTTDGGMTISIDPRHVIKDTFRFVSYKVNRVMKLVGSKNYVNPAGDTNTNVLLEVSNAIERLKSAGILSNEAPGKPGQYPAKLHGRMLTIGYLVEQLHNN